jgi:peptide chain release factor 2
MLCPPRAQAISDLKLQLSDTKRVVGILSDAQTALELLSLQDAQEEGSTELLHEAGTSLQHLEAALDAWELERLLDMPYASSGAVLTITAGAGGTDAQARVTGAAAIGWAGDASRQEF